MPTYRITYRYPTGLRMLLEDVEADEMDMQQDGRWVVLWRAQLVVG